MTTYVIGLGNPGPEYAGTRHNAGRMTAQNFAEKSGFGEFKPEKKIALVSTGKLRKNFVISILPELYMNNSGKAVAGFVKPKKSLPNVIVLHDDVDLPLGKFKIVFNRGSGGHKGVESVIRALKTEAFVRVRVGISPKKKPNHRELLKFLTSKFKPSELKILKTISKKVLDALEMIVAEGHEKAMSLYNK
ncbi:aminoacyl-tRNA hydrolase [Candidatus Giovannonibacteria bacterium]|nr:aminoacyl-tRNA hydrolase [Candidatus Giovannonibacteria bacterium]